MAETSSIERLRVELDDRGYDILIGPGLIARAGAEMLPLMRRRQAVIVTDETVAGQHLKNMASLSTSSSCRPARAPRTWRISAASSTTSSPAASSAARCSSRSAAG